MKIRKIVYNLDFIPILNFNEKYRSVIEPFFAYNNFKFAIDSENTINERIRLVFQLDNFVFNFRKEGATMAYEGDVEAIAKNNPIVTMFFDIYEKIKELPGYHKTISQKLIINAVDIQTKDEVDEVLLNNKFVFNPFGKLDEFSAILAFVKDEKKYLLQFGNYDESDNKKFELTSFKVEYNKDLNEGNIGRICHLEITEETNNSNISKLKSLLINGEKIIDSYLENLP